MFKALLNGYHFSDIRDVFESQFPSYKYHVTLLTIAFSTVVAQTELIFGFKMYTLVAFIIAALVELGSGVYASVVARKEPFESAKLGRWALKFIMLMFGLYILHQFGRQGIGSNELIAGTFQWIYAFLFTEGALEYTLSIFENYAMISGKPKDYYVSTILNKVNSTFGVNTNTNTPSK